MNHQDAQLTDVIIVLEELDDAQTQEVVKRLESVGLTVSKIDNDESTVEGSIVSQQVHQLSKVPKVTYVRSIITYSVDYPPGDPRDLDGKEDPCDESED